MARFLDGRSEAQYEPAYAGIVRPLGEEDPTPTPFDESVDRQIPGAPEGVTYRDAFQAWHESDDDTPLGTFRERGVAIAAARKAVSSDAVLREPIRAGGE